MRIFKRPGGNGLGKLLAAAFALIVGLAAFANYSYQGSFEVPGAFSQKISLSSDYHAAMKAATPWMTPVVTREEYAATEWVKANTAEREIFVSDIFGGELIMGLSLREGTEGGDWAIVPNVVQRMADIDKFYKSNDPAEAHAIARKYNATYVWAPNRQVFAGYGWTEIGEGKFDPAFFELVFENRTRIYRLK